ncbi:Cof-type HAD-IIB family hydrolase [Pseudoclavibacter chungangensis]|uniref:Cof-type HAD-IIB family hydrolase n=1 Tax=Pseudoclavibacter chungangensis TaxID=587635 RepID=A0A7J5C1P4_9MICO|nr:Cof-type HAD-IIB family hydrolase [Pseudoclavibacter chungangensis]KAB1662534.1 Cof-type HAD-IIB family hydrolase [Pseudoclavibacter chungangensis]NYJ68574.1 hypothetical protein [Pseudoclavibacter chungangensis]
MDRWAVFLDIDGTLVGHDRVPVPSAVEAVRATRRQGHLVFVCTGRSASRIPAELLDIGFDGVVSSGGGFAELDGEIVVEHTMPPERTRRLVATFERRGLPFTLQSYDGVYASPGVHERVLENTVRRILAEHPGTPRADALAAAAAHPQVRGAVHRGSPPDEGVASAVYLTDDPDDTARMRAELGDAFHLVTGTVPGYGPDCGEVHPIGLDKGTTIRELLDRLGIPRERSIGIGDGRNDIGMFAACGIGVAMGNAPLDVREAADEVTTSIDEDGVRHALERHGLTGQPG